MVHLLEICDKITFTPNGYFIVLQATAVCFICYSQKKLNIMRLVAKYRNWVLSLEANTMGTDSCDWCISTNNTHNPNICGEIL